MITMGKDGMRQSAAIHNAHTFRTTSVLCVKFIEELYSSEQGIIADSEYLTQNSTYLNSQKLASGHVRLDFKLIVVQAKQIFLNL